MKKVFKIGGIILTSVLLLLLILPVAFKGKVKEVIIAQGNKMLDAEFTFETVRISFIRSFPKATLSVTGFTICGVGDFIGDTLVSAGRLSATVNLKSLFSDTGYDVSKVLISEASVKAVILEDGRVNWDIFKGVSGDGATEGIEEESSAFRLQLKEMRVEKSNAVYDDREGGIYVSALGTDIVCSGDLSSERSLLKIEAGVKGLGFRYGGVSWLSDGKLLADMDIDADFSAMTFRLNENTVSLNALTAAIDGTFAIPEEGFDLDLRIETGDISFKELLSMVPAIYSREFASLSASGDVSLNAWTKGRLTDELLPAFEVSLNVSDGTFRYPSLPKSVDNIRVDALAANPGGDANETIIDIRALKFSIAGNPFAATFHLTNLLSDPSFSATAEGTLDLSMIKEVYPLENLALNGLLVANLDFKGLYSYIEEETYDKLRASGSLRMEKMAVEMEDMPDIRIDKSLLTFTPQYLYIDDTEIGVGRSNLSTACRLENYLGFALKGETLRGRLTLNSDMLDVNEILTGFATPEEPEEIEEPLMAFEVPLNLDLEMTASIRKVYFDRLNMDELMGQVVVRDGKIDMRNLSLRSLGGNITANGYYSTVVNAKEPLLDAAFKMEDLSFAETFKTFVIVQQIAPLFENLKGVFSGEMTIYTRLDTLLTPILQTVDAEGVLNTREVNLSGIKTLDMVADLTGYQPLKNLDAQDVRIHFIIKDGRVVTKPFDIKAGGGSLNLSGSTGIDRTIGYTGRITLPAAAGAVGRWTTLDLTIGGTFTEPKVSLDTKGMITNVVEGAIEETRERVLDEVGRQLGVDISDAERQRELLIEEARRAGDKLVEEAQKQAEALVEQAGNAITRLAAQRAGAKLIEEAQKQADALVAKATEEGDKLIEKEKND